MKVSPKCTMKMGKSESTILECMLWDVTVYVTSRGNVFKKCYCSMHNENGKIRIYNPRMYAAGCHCSINLGWAVALDQQVLNMFMLHQSCILIQNANISQHTTAERKKKRYHFLVWACICCSTEQWNLKKRSIEYFKSVTFSERLYRILFSLIHTVSTFLLFSRLVHGKKIHVSIKIFKRAMPWCKWKPFCIQIVCLL